MGKMLNALLLVFAIEVSFYIFPNPAYEQTSLFLFLLNPQAWANMPFLGLFVTAIAGISIAAALVIGTFVSPGGREWVWRAVLAATFFTFGATTFHLSTFFYGHLKMYFPYETLIFNTSTILTAVLVAPFVLYFIFAALDFISGKD